MTLTFHDLRSYLPSDLSGSQSMSRSALTKERRWWRNERSISSNKDVIDEKHDETAVP